MDKCDVSTVELLARLRLEGVDCLRHTIHTVPEGFLTTRESSSVNKMSMVPLSWEECRELIKFFAGHTTLVERWNILHNYEKEM